MHFKKNKNQKTSRQSKGANQDVRELSQTTYFHLNRYYKILPKLDSSHLVHFSKSSICDLVLWSYSVHQKPPWGSPTCRPKSGPLSRGPACSGCILVFQDSPLTEPDTQPEFQDSVPPLILSLLPGMLFSLHQVLDTLDYLFLWNTIIVKYFTRTEKSRE